MARSPLSIVFVAEVLINAFLYCSTENVYCVKPNVNSCSSCPPKSTHCATLSEYAQEAELYFTPNTTMVYLPGDHNLDVDITVNNVTRLTMHGESSSENIATVVRKGSFGFNFTNVVNLSIHSLAFASYRTSWGYGSDQASSSALVLQSVQYAELTKCFFHENTGTALVLHNTNVALVENKFIHNQCAYQPFSEIHTLGCGITALNSNLIFTGNTTFLENHQNASSSSYCAGAIWASASSLNFSGMNIFIGNSAEFCDGGAIHASNNASLNFNGTSNFSHNSAYSGGAIFTLDHTVLIFNGTSNFINNSAGYNGGVIYTQGKIGKLIFNGNSNFINNSAGYKGGVIFYNTFYIEDKLDKLTFNGISNFINNSAGYNGGVIYADGEYRPGKLTFNGTNNFINNSAIYCGGAIHANRNVVLNFNGTNNFINNSAHSDGGVIFALYAKLNFNGTNNFINSSAQSIGGAIYAVSKMVTFNGISIFSCNSAKFGGAIYASKDVKIVFRGTNSFINNSAIQNGGVICGQMYDGSFYSLHDIVLSFNGTNNFIGNSAQSDGGVIYLNDFHRSQDVVLFFIGANKFINNSAKNHGGAIYASSDVIITFNITNIFISNMAQSGGVIYTSQDAVLTFIGANSFINNSVEHDGGAIYANAFSCLFNPSNIVVTFSGDNNFVSNSAHLCGGAIYAKIISLHKYIQLCKVALTFNGTNNFFNNSSIDKHGGAVYAGGSIAVAFNGTNNFTSNLANGEGGAISIEFSISLTFTGTSNFHHNSASQGGAISAKFESTLTFTGTSNFHCNSASQGGAISAKFECTLTFEESINFTNNGHISRDSQGGALYLAISSTFFIVPNTTMCWENNHATFGGAIYVLIDNAFLYCTQIAKYLPNEKCFFQPPSQELSNGSHMKLLFKNNSAGAAGSVLYGGAIDNCKLTGIYNSRYMFNMLFHYNADNTTSSISSDPFHLCPCENNSPNCSTSNKVLSVYPGETFQVSVVSTGQRNGIVPAEVRSHLESGRLQSSQYVQKTHKVCTTFNYTVYSQQNVSLELYADGPCSTFGNKLVLNLDINQTCPPGFIISREESACVCDQALQKYTNNCNITNGLGQITRDSSDTFWIGYDQSHRLTVNPYCPFDYCVNEKVFFPLTNTDIQCAYNRSGLLCAACKNSQCNNSLACNSKGYSLVLGSSHCKQCTNTYLLLLIPFAVMGIALVFLLFVCKLTVASGTLSGIVFYANIVGANHTVFIPVKTADAFSVFVAWLNLDFGIEACFYDGMDTYSKTWLQYVFPAYIWLLVGLMIYISYYSQRFAHLLGSNPVSVLATLILLSYAKILHTFITTFSIIDLQYQEQINGRAWLYDAHIQYLAGKHIPLFLVALFVLLFLFLPYTILLLFGQWMQTASHLRLFSWVNSSRLKPFMDSYHAPYKAKHRYWPGLLLVLRFVLLLVFAHSANKDHGIDLLATVVGAGILQLWAWVSGGVYKNWCLDALEGSFMLNLTVLAAATYHVQLFKGNQLVVAYTSISIAFVTFIGILTYHSLQQLKNTKLWKKFPKLNFKFKSIKIKQTVDNLDTPINNSTESVNLDQLREPWLEDLQPTHSSF